MTGAGRELLESVCSRLQTLASDLRILREDMEAKAPLDEIDRAALEAVATKIELYAELLGDLGRSQ